MKKITMLMLVLFATVVLQACSSSNGDRAKAGKSDTVGSKTNSSLKDNASGTTDTLKHP